MKQAAIDNAHRPLLKLKLAGEGDIERVITAARAIAVPNDRRILHVIPQEFVVDDQSGIELPVGMAGIRLEVKAHIITCSATCAQNIVKSVKKAGLDIDALRIVANGVNKLHTPENSAIVVTHYQRLLEYIVPDHVHVLSEGRIVRSGDRELALELEARGYSWLEEAPPAAR